MYRNSCLILLYLNHEINLWLISRLMHASMPYNVMLMMVSEPCLEEEEVERVRSESRVTASSTCFGARMSVTNAWRVRLRSPSIVLRHAAPNVFPWSTASPCLGEVERHGTSRFCDFYLDLTPPAVHRTHMPVLFLGSVSSVHILRSTPFLPTDRHERSCDLLYPSLCGK